MPSYFVLLGALGVAWALQLWLSMQQMRRFYRRLAELRRLGRTAMGIGGGMYRGRAYAVVVVDSSDRVIRAEVMTGISVFASLKELPGLSGRLLESLCESPPDSMRANVRQALCKAATAVKQQEEVVTPEQASSIIGEGLKEAT